MLCGEIFLMVKISGYVVYNTATQIVHVITDIRSGVGHKGVKGQSFKMNPQGSIL